MTGRGAELIAARDISLSGSSVTLDAARDQMTHTRTTEQKTSGITVALSGTAGGALNTAVHASSHPAVQREEDKSDRPENNGHNDTTSDNTKGVQDEHNPLQNR